jgi:CDP-glycerol glycerophosphotransferase
MQYIKIAIVYLLRFLLKIFCILPIKQNRIVFVSYEGRQYSCNPKYIFEYMQIRYGNKYQYVWCLNSRDFLPKKYQHISLVKFLSFGYLYFIMTSKYIISNQLIEPFFPLRKKQMFTNTWHGGGAYKKMDISSSVFKHRFRYMSVSRTLRSKITAHTISSCEKFTYYYAKEWNLPTASFLPIGLPRNDVFFNGCPGIKQQITDLYNIKKQNKLVLYAPTLRGDHYNPQNLYFSLDIERLLNALKNRFTGDFSLLYRSHYMYNNTTNAKNVVDVSKYPDMQELLCAVEVLLTDYSSSIWDFSFTGKPCFLYTPDLSGYKSERDFYTPIESWPFPLAETEEQLFNNIITFDEIDYKQKVEQHHKDLGSYEHGNASENFVKAVMDD